MNPQELFFECTCGLWAHFERAYPGDGLSAVRFDVYRCPSGHVVQVIYPVTVGVSQQRLKPTTPPSFPGSW